MKKVLAIVLLVLATNALAQKNVFQKKGIAVKGYDVVSYFDGEAQEGSKEFSTSFEGVDYYFKNAENKQKFEKNPSAYLPQYGGFCAYAMGAKGKKVSIDPKTFEIRDDKLYLFYNKGRTNTLQLWLQEGAKELQSRADMNWDEILKN